ncbi:hypothetical protein KUTeg_020596 [Tegillarca granosa]|uniref:Uncharacterized protein n=1 Tax=Tegillarca granosa TaxID=220873 RepID=A0ABQ9E8D7_TEGGR|nr:hypothetical protein KUTeg_020596 [Tegillarca granosa]
MALIARRPISQRRAIAIETSAQNVALCITLIAVTFEVNYTGWQIQKQNESELITCVHELEEENSSNNTK